MMMMGSAYYGNGGSSSSSSSSLSAAAPPFTVDRSVPKPFSPLIDFTDQSYHHHPAPKLNSTLQHNWLPSNSTRDFFSTSATEFDPISSSVDYTYSPSVAHVGTLNPVSPSVHDDVHYSLLPDTLPEPSNPYYQSFVSSSSRNKANSNLPSQSGHELLSSIHVVTPSRPSGDSFTQTVSPMDHSLQWSGMWDGLSDWQQSNQVQRDGSFDCNDNYMNQGFYAPKNIIYDEGFNGIDAGIQKHVKHADSEHKDSNSFLGENPEFLHADYSTVVTCTSALSAPKPYSKFSYLAGGSSVGYESPLTVSIDKCSRKRSPSSIDAHFTTKLPSTVTIRPPHKEKFSLRTMSPQIGKVKVSSRDSPPTIKETDQCRKTESKPYFDATQLRFHLGKTDDEQTSNASGTGEGHSVAKPRMPVPQVCPDGFSVAIDDNNTMNSGDAFAESSDHHSSALDSPCWKGATVSHWSTFEVVRPSNIRKLDDLNGTNLLGSQTSPFKANATDGADPQKIGEYEVNDFIRGPEGRLASFEGLTGGNGFVDEGICGPVKFQGQNAAVGYSTGVPLFDDIHGSIKRDSLHEQLVENSDGESPKNQISEEGQGIAVKHSGFTGGTHVNLQTKTDDLEYRASHVPYHAVEHVLLSPSSAELSPSELMRPRNCQSAPDVYIQTLVSSMRNLSELLLFRCSNEASELREEDCETLKEVLNNILSSVMNNANGLAPLEKLLTPERQNQLHALRKGSKVDVPQVSSPVKVQPLKEDHSTLDHIKDGKLPNLSSESAATEIVKHNSTMQALKKILAENLHEEDDSQPETLLYKNLWLEAEAQLCSVNHVARYNRMKFEMEKYHSQQPNVVSQNTMSMGMSPRPTVSSDIFSKGTLRFDTKSPKIPGSPDSDMSVSSANSNPDETVARSQAFTSPSIKSVTTNDSAIENDKESGKANGDKKDGTKADVFIQESPFSSRSSPMDMDASVMARFEILRHRADNLSSKATDEHQPECADLAYPFVRSPQPIYDDVPVKTIMNGKVEKILQNESVKSMEGQLFVKEHFNLQKGNEAPTMLKSDDAETLNTYTTDMETGLVPPLKGPNFCSTNHPPDVSARFAMLKSRAEKQGSPKSSSSKISPVPNIVDVLDTDKPKSLVHDHLMSGTASHISDAEALYNDQVQTLKRMVDTEAWPPGGLRRNWPFNVDESPGRSMAVNMESLQMGDDDAPFSEDKSDVEAFHSCARYDPVIMHPMANRRSGDQSHVSWCEMSSSDWEHVLKEEVAGKPC